MGSDLAAWASAEGARWLQDASPGRWRHIEGVAAVAREIAPDSQSVIAAAWLHDVGYADAIAESGFHPLDGADYLRREGVDPVVVSLVAYHTGAEYEAEERGLVDRLKAFDRPEQHLLDRLILADLVTSPTGERTTVADRLDEISQRYEAAHPVHRAVARSRPYLEMCAVRAAASVGYPM